MAYIEKILSTDYLNDGRVKINQFFSNQVNLIYSGSGAYSIFANNYTGNIASASGNTVLGFNNQVSANLASALGGSGNTVSAAFGSVVSGKRNFNSGTYSVISGGDSNRVYSSANFGFIGGGSGNTAMTASYITIGGGKRNKVSAKYSFIGGGNSNSGMSAGYAVVAGGKSNIVSGASFMGAVVNGSSNTASGYMSTVVNGRLNIATNTRSFIGNGRRNTASGTQSFVGSGNYNKASGYYSFIGNGGYNIPSNFNTASGSHSFIGNGESNTSSNSKSFIGNGFFNFASGFTSFIGNGSSNTASGKYSAIAGGRQNKALEKYTFIGGGRQNTINSNSDYSSILGGKKNTLVSNNGKSVILGGSYNTITSNSDHAIAFGFHNTAGNYATVINGLGNHAFHGYSSAFGGGSYTRAAFDIVLGATNTVTPSTANNTIRLQGTGGNVKIDGTVSSPESDYAEFFEWSDGNVNDEDRKGLFVSLNGDKIEIGNSNLVGIVSVNPSVVGDSASNKWINMYLRNDWGEKIYENYNSYKIPNSGFTIFVDSNNNILKEYPNPSNKDGIPYTGSTLNLNGLTPKTVSYPKMNPNYDPSVEYIPREDRKEWSPVGMLGKLLVRTSEQITGTKVDADSNGMAVNGTKYHVLKTVREFSNSQYGIVQILFK
jgi:hypothetical protein